MSVLVRCTAGTSVKKQLDLQQVTNNETKDMSFAVNAVPSPKQVSIERKK